MKPDQHHPLSCASGERGVWLNLQTICLLLLCTSSAMAAAAIITVTVVCNASLHVTFVNGTLVCGNNMEERTTGSRFELSGNGDRNVEGYNHTLGSVMRIILVLIVVAIIIVVTLISMHKVVQREKHRKLSTQLSQLMMENNVNTKGVNSGSQNHVNTEGVNYGSQNHVNTEGVNCDSQLINTGKTGEVLTV